MNISFNRRELQIECEKQARLQQGLPLDSEEFVFNNLEITPQNVAQMIICQSHDSVSFYFNAVFTFLQAMKSLLNKSYSWSTVQMYYSVFYACKSILGFDNIGIIRNHGLHVLNLRVGEKAKKLKKDNDHDQTIQCYKKLYPSSYMMSNNIEDQSFFEWIKDAREITNYRQQVFQEPRALDFLYNSISYLDNKNTLCSYLDEMSSNWNLYCFQKETALIAGSYRMLVDSFSMYENQTEKISVPEKKVISKLIRELRIQDLNEKFVEF